MSAEKGAATGFETVEVALLKKHTHAGVECAKGDTITIAKKKTAWLKERGIIA